MPQGDSPSEARRLIYEATLPYIDADRRSNELRTSQPDARDEIAQAGREWHQAFIHLARRYREEIGAAKCGASEADAHALRIIDQLCTGHLNPPRPSDFPGFKDEIEGLMAAGARDRSAADEERWMSASKAQRWVADAGIKISLQTMQNGKDRKAFASREGGSDCHYEVEAASFAAWAIDWWGEQLARKKRRNT
jgi:hypothetical protein